MKNRKHSLYYKLKYKFEHKIYYPICKWIGHHILHLDNRKHFKEGDIVYTWDNELNCVDKGIIVYVEDYIDDFTGALKSSIKYHSENLTRLSSVDDYFYKTYEECLNDPLH